MTRCPGRARPNQRVNPKFTPLSSMNFKCSSRALHSSLIRCRNWRRRRRTRGVSRRLSWSDFFSRQMQTLQLSAHGTGTNLHANVAGQDGRQFAECDVWLSLHFGTNEWSIVLEYTFQTVRWRQRRCVACLPLSSQPFLHGRQTNTKGCSAEGLSLFTGFGFRNDAFSQILAIRLHAPKSSRFLP